MTFEEIEALAHRAARSAISELPESVQPYATRAADLELGAARVALHPVSSAAKVLHVAQQEVDRHAREAGRSFGAGAREGAGVGGLVALGGIGLGLVLLVVTVKDW